MKAAVKGLIMFNPINNMVKFLCNYNLIDEVPPVAVLMAFY